MGYRVRVLQQPDGTVTVIHPAMNDHSRPPGIADEAWALHCLDKTLAKRPEWQGLPSIDLSSDALPSRRFREAWTMRDGQLTHDMDKARALRLAEIHAARDARLAAADSDATRRRIRTVAQGAAARLTAITTPEALAADEPAWPTEPA